MFELGLICLYSFCRVDMDQSTVDLETQVPPVWSNALLVLEPSCLALIGRSHSSHVITPFLVLALLNYTL